MRPALVLALVLFESIALASPLLLFESIASASPLVESHLGGPVFDGPTSPSITAVFYNPAAAGLLKGTHLVIAGSTRLDLSTVDRDPIDTATGAASSAGNKSFDKETLLGVTPGGFIGVLTDFNRHDVTLGLALYDPFAEVQPDGDSTVAYHQQGGYLLTTAATISVSYRVTGKIYIGFGFNLEFTKIDYSFLRDTVLDTCSAPPCGVEDPTKADHYRFVTAWDASPLSNWSPVFSINLGLLFNLGGWWFGGSFTSPPFGTGGTGVDKDATVEVTRPGATSPIFADGRVTFNLPYIIQGGARTRLFGDYDFLINARFVTTSAFQNLDLRIFGNAVRQFDLPEWIPRYRGMSDVFSLEAGIENQPAAPLRLGARVRFETSAVPSDTVAADEIDAPKLELSAGAEIRLSKQVALIGGYTLSLLMPVHPSPGVYSPADAIACNGSSHDLSTPACVSVVNGEAISSASGAYWKLGNQLTLGVSIDWW